jgi:hypothetical protein
VPCRGTAPLCPSSRRLSPVPAGEVRRVPPSAQPFFQPFPCPVKCLLFSQGRPCLPQSTHVPSRESREKVRSQDFLEGCPHPASPTPQGRGPSRPPHSQESFCMINHACTRGTGVCPLCQQVFKASLIHVGRGRGVPYKYRFFRRETRGWCGGAPLYLRTLFQALHLPCGIVLIPQGLPVL